MKSVKAVVDTNVIVSGLIAKQVSSPVVKILIKIYQGEIIPVYNDEIIEEYREVLNRPKFKFGAENVDNFISEFKTRGISMDRLESNEDFPDEDDRVFYEVSLSADSYLVTGNLKHFPIVPRVVSPLEMLIILENIKD